MSKPELKVKDYSFQNLKLIFKIEGPHPTLGDIGDQYLRSSDILKIETKNTIYILKEENEKSN